MKHDIWGKSKSNSIFPSKYQLLFGKTWAFKTKDEFTETYATFKDISSLLAHGDGLSQTKYHRGSHGFCSVNLILLSWTVKTGRFVSRLQGIAGGLCLVGGSQVATRQNLPIYHLTSHQTYCFSLYAQFQAMK